MINDVFLNYANYALKTSIFYANKRNLITVSFVFQTDQNMIFENNNLSGVGSLKGLRQVRIQGRLPGLQPTHEIQKFGLKKNS